MRGRHALEESPKRHKLDESEADDLGKQEREKMVRRVRKKKAGGCDTRKR